ncbi:Alpha/Beta hydrolase protein [Xylariaceae sp. FL1651]|nr:Alpha/Beta hydrolase protein [Xylariaceae sp. FL1651]
MTTCRPIIPEAKLRSVKIWDNADNFLVKDIRLECPIDYTKPPDQDNAIEVSFKLVYGKKGDEISESITAGNINATLSDKNILVYLCGGPGEKNQPTRNPSMNNFLLSKGYWILFPDYRGTGDSSLSSLSLDNIKSLGDRNDFQGLRKVQDQIEHLRHFDIVRDLESVRRCLLGRKKWTTLGQSFGGWITLTYLSFLSEGLERVFMTGGLAPIKQTHRAVFEHLFERVIEANERYYNVYRDDEEKVRNIVTWLAKKGAVKLFKNGKNAGVLTAQRFLCLGRSLGDTTKFSELHDLFEDMAEAINTHSNADEALKIALEKYQKADNWRLDTRPLYAILSELQYCSLGGSSSNWAAEAAAEKKKQFWWVNCAPEAMIEELESRRGEKLYFSGEMIYPFFFDTCAGLNSIKRLANDIANKRWEEDMYDFKALKENKVPVTALSYKQDMYVDFEDSKETCGLLGGVEDFIEHPTFEHGAIRAKCQEVMDLLWSKIN